MGFAPNPFRQGIQMDATEVQAPEAKTSQEAAAMSIVFSYTGWTAGASLIPLPLIDLAGVTLVQLKMLHSLSELYGVPFSRSAAKATMGALIGSGGAFLLGPTAGSVLKVIPGIGSIAGALAVPAAATAATYALGRVFIQHFESGGTFLDFNPEEVRQYFNEQFRSAQSGAAHPTPATKQKV
jgi:uncharacterized protein (DUF697 family)